MNLEQKVFNKVRDHLLKQMKKSIGGDPNDIRCFYRGPNNTKCAIGCLIPNDKYARSLEGQSAYSDDIQNIIPEIQNSDFYGDLQAIHDQWDPCNWAKQLNLFAERYSLEP